jgi:hypothetical protein
VNIDFAHIIDVSDRFHPDVLAHGVTRHCPVGVLKKDSAEIRVKKEESERTVSCAVTYRRACSLRFVFLDPGLVTGEAGPFAVEFFLRQEIAHQRFWNCGNSHIFVQCFTPVSYAQWQ